MLQHPGHGLDRIHIGQEFAQDPDSVIDIRLVEEVVATGRGKHQVHRRKDSLVGQVAVQLQFHVAGSLELFEDDIVHLGSCLRKGGGQNGERTAILDIPGRTEETFGFLQGIGVHTTGQDLTGRGLHCIIGTGQTGDGIQEDHHIVTAFHQTAGFVQHHIGHFDVALGRFVKSGSYDLGFYGALHVRHFFRTLVHQQDDFVYFRMIVGNGIGNGLQKHGFTGFGLRHDEAALAFADGRKHVYHTDALVFLVSMTQKIELLGREQGSEEVEGDPVPHKFRRAAVDEFDFHQREILVSLARRTDFTRDSITVFQRILFDLLLGNINIVRGIEVIVITGAQETISIGHDFQHTGSFYRAFEFHSGRLLGCPLLRDLWLNLRRLLLLLLLLLLQPLLFLGLGWRAGLNFLLLGIILFQIREKVVDKLLPVHFRSGSGCGSRFRRHFLGLRSCLFLGFAAAVLGRGFFFGRFNIGLLFLLRGGFCRSRSGSSRLGSGILARTSGSPLLLGLFRFVGFNVGLRV